MLRQVYGSEKVLSPYVLNIDAIKDYGIEGQPLSPILCHDSSPSCASCKLVCLKHMIHHSKSL